jgi:hypothetical protein
MKEQRLIELLFEVKQGDKSPNQAWKEIMNLFNNGVLDDVIKCDCEDNNYALVEITENLCLECNKPIK